MSDSLRQFPNLYGPWAVVAGASEGLGVAFARRLVAREMNLLLIARRAAFHSGVGQPGRRADHHPADFQEICRTVDG